MTKIKDYLTFYEGVHTNYHVKHRILASFFRRIMSGWRLKTLFREIYGNFISIFSTSVVFKVPFEVPQILECVLSVGLVYLSSAFFTKTRSPSDPLSRRTRQALVGGRAPSLVTRIATATVDTRHR